MDTRGLLMLCVCTWWRLRMKTLQAWPPSVTVRTNTFSKLVSRWWFITPSAVSKVRRRLKDYHLLAGRFVTMTTGQGLEGYPGVKNEKWPSLVCTWWQKQRLYKIQEREVGCVGYGGHGGVCQEFSALSPLNLWDEGEVGHCRMRRSRCILKQEQRINKHVVSVLLLETGAAGTRDLLFTGLHHLYSVLSSGSVG